MPYPPLPAPGNQDFQEETPTRSPAGPGHPTLKPGLLTRPAAPSREPDRWSPRERFCRWSPRFDLGFGRLVSDFQASRGTLRPRSGEPGLRPALPAEGPLPGVTPTRAPGEPGHPTLKPGLLTRPAVPSGRPARWSPREGLSTAGHPVST
ncbi:hypothetical protein ROHU_028406 [Labeo rohita]|uniref:Uncharacterized protein n=1 Tax=Labeo rohita TaxID=84645 RepID=A0A498M754_LABRO|nr:hypothetical protein ROHU_028406 [Labeo rohita]